MIKYGKKILAVMIAAMCFFSTLPLFANAATEEIYHPAVVTISTGYRYSYSGGAYVDANGRACITIPFDTTENILSIVFNTAISFNPSVIIIDENYRPLEQIYLSSGQLLSISNLPTNKGYLILNDDQTGSLYPSDITISVDGMPTTVIYALYTEAEFAYYETIVSPEPPQSNDITGSILAFWQDVLNSIVDELSAYYRELVNPLGLLIGVPLIIALISLLFKFFGGKFR